MIEVLLVLAIPMAGAAILALVGDRDDAPRVNIAASSLTFAAAVALTIRVIAGGPLLVLDRMFFVDPFNVFLVALTAFVGFTTAIFSGPYMRIERDHGRLTPARLRLYHSMYQLFNFTMLLALLTNNMGILWVALEAATLTTVLLVSLYRTPASLEAAWKYFILCGVGIAQALFGTILLYFAAERLLGAEGGALLWTQLNEVKADLEPTVLSLAFVSCWWATVRRSASCRCTTGCPMRTPKARRRSRRYCPGCFSTSRCTPWFVARYWSKARSTPSSPRN
jgi:hydrogenase-4 component F